MKFLNSPLANAGLTMFYFILMQVVGGVFLLFITGGEINLSNPNYIQSMMWIMLLCDFLMLILLWVSHCIRKNPFKSTFSLSLFSYAAAVICIISLGAAESAILWFLGIDESKEMELMFGEMGGSVLGFIVICLFGPLVEELVFREGIQRNLILSGMKPQLAILITALLFSVIHANLAQSIPAFFSGLLLGWLYLLSGNIILSSAAHIANNSFAFALLSFEIGDKEPINNMTDAFIFLFVGLGVFVLFAWLLAREIKRNLNNCV